MRPWAARGRSTGDTPERHGQDKSELGAAAGAAADRDGAAVRLDDALDDVQAEARPAALAPPPEAGEDTAHRLLGDAGTFVAHGDGRSLLVVLVNTERARVPPRW